MAETDIGEEYRAKIAALQELLELYREGKIHQKES
jgi:hypothetical protein